ncbi:hypothetical protein [Nitrosomonas mobilis]|uniref:hypothetical protein n=1 Tax=Nitrosomonas mobilis TaxID=51642 RepID=UPI003CCBF437
MIWSSLAGSMPAITFDFSFRSRSVGGGDQSGQGGLNLAQMPLCLFDIGSMRLNSWYLVLRRLAPFSVLHFTQ